MLHKLAGDDVDTTTTKLDITNLDAIRAMVKENDVKVTWAKYMRHLNKNPKLNGLSAEHIRLNKT